MGSMPAESASDGSDQAYSGHAQQTADKNACEEFLIPEDEEVVLKYVNGDGVAELFSYQPFGFEGSVALRAGSSVLASVDVYSYGRPGKAYQRMSDDYVTDLRSDVERCMSGAMSYNTSLATVCDSESYALLVNTLADVGIETFDATIAHLVIEGLPRGSEEAGEEGDAAIVEDGTEETVTQSVLVALTDGCRKGTPSWV